MRRGLRGLGCGCNCGGKCGDSMSGIVEDVGGWKKLAISFIITGVVYGIGYYRGLNAKK